MTQPARWALARWALATAAFAKRRIGIAGAFLTALLAATAPSLAQAPFDAARANQLGIRKLEGRHISLFTDLPSSPAIDELPAVFDAAVPEWEKFFGRPAGNWKILASLMRDAAKFRACGLLPAHVPDFPNGFSLQNELWLFEQPTDYYRRHLLLHEGTHCYTILATGASGPPWYFEGLAELLGTHRWQDGKLQLGIVPRDRLEAEHWSRVKIVRDEVAAGRYLNFGSVMSFGPRAHRENEPYGWCWAAAAFLHHHPDYRDVLREMLAETRQSAESFNTKFGRKIGSRWQLLEAEWQFFVHSIDYGYQFEAEAIRIRPLAALPAAGGSCQLDVAHGWQAAGYRVRAGATYELTATGQFQIDDDPRPWISEANGVTLAYHQGRPVGLLLAAVYDARFVVGSKLTEFCQPREIGTRGTFRAPRDGILFLRVNDAPASLSNNRGTLAVTIRETIPPPGS